MAKRLTVDDLTFRQNAICLLLAALKYEDETRAGRGPAFELDHRLNQAVKEGSMINPSFGVYQIAPEFHELQKRRNAEAGNSE
jgi:hypothetical protein